jgi:hypothetical protein
MPVDQETTLSITCDNPACPGNDLDATDRIGWTFVSTEVYGQPGTQFVYCCGMCWDCRRGCSRRARPERNRDAGRAEERTAAKK